MYSITCIFWLQSLKSYAVCDLHHSSVTCFEWSLNGMKLFSGDSAGAIVCTEFDYTIVRTFRILIAASAAVSADFP